MIQEVVNFLIQVSFKNIYRRIIYRYQTATCCIPSSTGYEVYKSIRAKTFLLHCKTQFLPGEVQKHCCLSLAMAIKPTLLLFLVFVPTILAAIIKVSDVIRKQNWLVQSRGKRWKYHIHYDTSKQNRNSILYVNMLLFLIKKRCCYRH